MCVKMKEGRKRSSPNSDIHLPRGAPHGQGASREGPLCPGQLAGVRRGLWETSSMPTPFLWDLLPLTRASESRASARADSRFSRRLRKLTEELWAQEKELLGKWQQHGLGRKWPWTHNIKSLPFIFHSKVREQCVDTFIEWLLPACRMLRISPSFCLPN